MRRLPASPSSPSGRAATGRRHWTPAAAFLLLALWPWAGRSAEITAGGVVFYGEVIRATSNVLTIRLDSGGMISSPRDEVGSVVMEVPNAGRVEGIFVDWRDGIYVLDTDAGSIEVSADGVLPSAASGSTERPAPPEAAEPRLEPAPPSVTM